jgi:hypothetical protein
MGQRPGEMGYFRARLIEEKLAAEQNLKKLARKRPTAL